MASQVRSKETPRQPDFAALFKDYFGERPRRRRYELRFDTSNLGHDLIFLGSLLHDAQLSGNTIRKRGTKVIIDVERDTWESYRAAELGLDSVPSRLSVSRVEEMTWRFENWWPKPDDLLTLHWLSLETEGHFGKTLLSLIGFAWRLDLLLSDADPSVVLRDTSVPKRRSARRLPSAAAGELPGRPQRQPSDG